MKRKVEKPLVPLTQYEKGFHKAIVDVFGKTTVHSLLQSASKFRNLAFGEIQHDNAKSRLESAHALENIAIGLERARSTLAKMISDRQNPQQLHSESEIQSVSAEFEKEFGPNIN